MTESSRQPLREQLRELPPAAWILFGGTLINRFGSFVMPFLVIYLTRQGYSIARAGLAISAYGAGHVVASMLGGHLADRIGRRHTIAMSMFGSAVVMTALSQAHSYWTIFVLTFFAGLSSEMYRPASHALLGDLVKPEHRMTAFAMYRFAVNLGFAAGPATAGFLADRSFLYVFLGDAATSVAYGIIAVIFLPHGLITYTKSEARGEALVHAMRNRRFLLFLLATTCVTVVDFQMASTVALHITGLGFSGATYGMLISFNGLIIILFELGITSFVQRFPHQPVIAVGYALVGIGFGLTGLAKTVPLLAITVLIWTMGEIVSSPAASAYVTQLAPEKYRGRYMGLWVTTFSIGLVVGPPIGTALLQKNPAVLWTGCALCGLTGAGLVLMNPRPAGDEAASAASAGAPPL